MMKRININFLTKAVQAALLALSLNLVMFSSSSAADIICGGSKCDISTRKCIETRTPGCSYEDINTKRGCYPHYKCVGKSEKMPENATEVTVSTTVDGEGHRRKILSAEEAEKLLPITKPAEYTDNEKKEIAAAYYKNLEQEDISDDAKAILARAQARGGSTEDILKDVAKLSEYTTIKGYNDGRGNVNWNWVDSPMEDTFQDIPEKLKKLEDGKYITSDERIRLENEITRVYQEANKRALEVSKQTKEDGYVEKLEKENIATVEYILQKCPTTAQLKARYGAGCWSCLVMERLTSAFLHAANKGLAVTQKAGMVLLWLGTAIWLVLWALKNVSSFTQIQLGNILNDLIKFLFKVAIAYWFIVYSATAISQYFIRPIMSVGAQIGQQFWDDKVVAYTEEWDDVEPVEDLQTLVDEAKKENIEEIKKNQETTLVTTPEEQEMLKNAERLELHESAKSDIPAFIVPGVPGVITSYPGCRVPPKTKTGYGSSSHMGLDIGGNNMAPIAAIAGGTITYSGTASSGWGLKAMIVTEHKGNKWIHLYGHMNPKTYEAFKAKNNGRKIVRGEQIGNVGTTGNSSGPHLHLEVQLSGKVGQYNYNKAYLDPISLGQGKIVPRAFDYNASSKTFTFNKKKCNGKAEPSPDTGYPKGAKLPEGGFSSTGQAGLDLSASYVYDGDGTMSGDMSYDSLVISTIPQDIKYTGPTNIMPKSVMNSILGAMRAITDTTADNMVLGNAIMCYSTVENGGAWNIKAFGVKITTFPNFFMWIEGAIIWCLGFMLTLAIAYYLVDISFKIGFAVLAIPVVMGLWPFGFTQGKLYIAISIIAKSSATFAFLAITTAFGMGLVSESLGGLDVLYEKMDEIAKGATDADEDQLREYINETIYLFSPTFIMMLFALIYFFKLVQQTSSDLVNKFFPDKAFGDSSPMHSAATMMTSWAKNMAMKMSGADLAKDIVANQAGILAKKGLQKTGGAILHPVRSAKGMARGAKNIASALKGSGNKDTGRK